ncbi:MAG: hypothetical protein COC19_05235, partial [SAR86 cluster bacterium]
MLDNREQLVLQGFDTLNYANGKPLIQAQFKQHCADFCVDEVLGFEFSGHGEHFCLQLSKRDISTADVALRIAKRLKIPLVNVGYSGLKDKRAITSQWFSVYLPGVSDAANTVEKVLNDIELHSELGPSIKILATALNDRKIRRGSHQGNQFKIRLTNPSGEAGQWLERLSSIANKPVPNYFGQQRFGYAMGNVTQAMSMFANLMAADVVSSPDVAALVSGEERAVDKGTRVKKGRRIGRAKRSMLISAARSYLFNQILSMRLEHNNWNLYLDGDVLNLEASNAFFTLSQEQAWDGPLEARLQAFDIHPTGLLYGIITSKNKYVSDAACQQ